MPREAVTRTVVVLIAIVVAFMIFAAPPLLRSFELRQRLRTARELVDQPDASKTTAECNRKLTCENGDPFHLYFWSTNGGSGLTVQGSYMLSVITLPDGGQFVKEERFSYVRARVIGDPIYELEDNIRWLGLQVPANGYDFWDIHHSKSHSELRMLLEKHGFTEYRSNAA